MPEVGFAQLIEAFKIFLKYDNPETPTHCEHDVMYIQIDWNIVSDEDKATLDDLGFFEDRNNGTFKSYRYGSA